jgi:hypothetical protein
MRVGACIPPIAPTPGLVTKKMLNKRLLREKRGPLINASLKPVLYWVMIPETQ